MVLAVFLASGLAFAAAWWWAGRLAWGARGALERSWWRRWGPGVAALAYPAYLLGALALRRWFDRDMLGVDAVIWAVFIVSTLPTLALGALSAAAARGGGGSAGGAGAWAVLVGSVAAGVIGPWAFYAFEKRTHGPWYIQSEALAALLSVSVGSAAWLACMVAGVAMWGMLARRRRIALRGIVCAACGYDVRGLGAEARCPECGGAVGGVTSA